MTSTSKTNPDNLITMTNKPIPKSVLEIERLLKNPFSYKPFSLILCLDKFNAYIETQGDTKAEFDLNLVQWWNKEGDSFERSDYRLFVFLNEQIKEISADYINQVQRNLKKHRIKSSKIKTQTKPKKPSKPRTTKKQNKTKINHTKL